MTNQSEIARWFKEGKKSGATHLIVACDSFDHEDYPVYVKPNEDVRIKESNIRRSSMQLVMEVYNLSMDMDTQLRQKKSFNY